MRSGIIGALSVLALSGCGLMSVTGSVPVDPGDSAPAPLIIGQLQLSPHVEQGPMRGMIEAQKYTFRNVMYFRMSDQRDPIDWDDYEESGFSHIFMGSPTPHFFSLKQQGVSVVPTQPGVRYIRKGAIDINHRCLEFNQRGCLKGVTDRVEMYRDIKIEVPAGATAVYIGKLVINHNGRIATSVKVVDDYDSAMAALRKQKFAGLDPSKVRKKLAVVYPK